MLPVESRTIHHRKAFPSLPNVCFGVRSSGHVKIPKTRLYDMAAEGPISARAASEKRTKMFQ